MSSETDQPIATAAAPDGRRIAVLGTGANGASIAADLVAAGHDVTLIEQWPAHVEAMRERGLRIEMPDDVLQVGVRAHHLCDVATFTEPFDVVLILVKAYDAVWATHLIEPHVAPDGLVVGVQNGMTADAIAEVVGMERTLGCVIECSSGMFDPGVVQRHTPPARSWFAVGALDAAAAGREEEIAGLLRHSGTVATFQDIRSAKWMKLVSNCTTLVTTAILGLPMLAALQTPGMRELMLRCGQETLDAGLALGHQALPIFGLTEAEIADTGALVETMLDTLYSGFVLPQTTTTILQDWEKGRHSEVDDLNGLAAAERRRQGVPAPANEAVVEIARRIERHALQTSPANLALLQELAGPTPVGVSGS
jgi:2-dehydropantoate 2-reductase